MKKIEYRIISGYMRHDIESEVEAYLNDDWNLVGGVCLASNGYYSQAVTRVVDVDIKDFSNEK